MRRLIFVALAFLVGCNGMGGGRVVPEANALDAPGAASRLESPVGSAHRKIKVKLTLTVPRRHRGERAQSKHPSTISGFTQSVSVAVNGGAASVFNATPSSPGCSVVSNGTICTFAVNAPAGSDTFVISTYSATSAGGTMLDRGSGVFAIATGKTNAVSITLGPVASTTADSGVGSLRYAIGSANPGDTILLMLAAGSTIALTSAPITVTNRVSIAGPGVTVSARRRGERHASATYSGVTISGGNARQIFIINAGATASISGLILTQGSAAIANNPGGAVSNAGTLTLASDVFTANTSTVDSPLVRRIHAPRAMHMSFASGRLGRGAHAPKVIVLPQLRPRCSVTSAEGGAVYNNGALSVTGTTFDGNVVAQGPCTNSYGGAIYNDEYGTIASSGNTYTNNAAANGGAVYNTGEYGQASFAGDTFDANLGCTAASGCPTSGCTTTGGCTSSAAGAGAAIFDASGPGISVSSSTFENNLAGGNSPGSQGSGGALFLSSGSPSITGSIFSGNAAGGGTSNCSTGAGGAILLVGGANSLTINNDTFTGNQASGDEAGVGGAIENDVPMNGSGDIFTSNVASAYASVCYTNPGAYGGAVFAIGGATLSNSSFSTNTSTSAVAAFAGAFFSGAPSRLTGDTFTSNAAIGSGVSGVVSAGFGGAVFDADILTISGSTFTSNSAQALHYGSSAYGGAVDIEGSLSSTNDTFTSNQVVGAGQPDEFGGAIYNDDGLVSTGDTFKSNVVSGSGQSFGGAMYSDAPLTLAGGTFASNSATGPEAGGGAIFSDDSGSTISNSVFTSNASSSPAGTEGGAGGAIFDDDGLTLSGSTLSGNSATQAGGAFFSECDDEIINSTISGNQVSAATANDGGGGIYGDAIVTLVGSTVSGNSVTVSGYWAGGGGIYNDSGLSMVGSTVSGNTVLGSVLNSGGAGIFDAYDATILNSTISGNNSSVDGGGFETYGNSVVNLTNVTLFANVAAGSGGNIDNPYKMNLANSIVAGGTAAGGPDISNTGTLTSQDYNLIQTAVAGNPLAGTTTHNLQTAPLLLALANNSGPTFTNAEQAGSPTVGLIPFVGGECGGDGNGFDQRGFLRGAGGVCDAGAFELAGVPTAARQAPPKLRGHRHHHRRMQPRAPHPMMTLHIPAPR